MKKTATAKIELISRNLKVIDPASVEIIWDSRVTGFGLRTRRSLEVTKWTWVLRFRSGGRGGDQPRLSKPYRDLNPEQARRWAERERALRGTPEGQRERTAEAKAARDLERATPDCERLWGEYWEGEGRLKQSSKYYNQLWRDHLSPFFGPLKVHQIRPADVERYKARMAVLPGACNRSLALLGRMFTLAVRWGYRPGCAPEHPVRGIARYAEHPSEFYFTEGELGRILQAADRDANHGGGLAIRMLAATGARAGEVTKAHWAQIEFLPEGGARWTVESTNTKAGRPITRYLDPDLAARLLKWKKLALGMLNTIGGPRWVFPQQPDPAKPMVRLQHVWKRVLKGAGVRQGRIHDLRHTAATLTLRATGSLSAVQAQLGHATMLTTRRYAHFMQEGMVETGALLGQIAVNAAAKARAAENTESAMIGSHHAW